MSMKKVIILLICVLVILGTGSYMLYGKINKPPEEEVVLSFDEDDIREINVKEKDGDFTWVKSGDSWEIAGDASELNSVAVSNYISEVIKIRGRRIAEKIETTADYGLDEPTAQIEYVLKDGTKTTVKLGNVTPVQTEYYMSDDENNLYVIYSSAGSEMKKRALDFRDTYVCSISYESIISIDISGTEGFSLENNGSDTWVFTRDGLTENVDVEFVKINVTKGFNNMYAMDIYRKTEDKLSEVATYETPVNVTFNLADKSKRNFELYGMDEKYCYFTLDDGEYIYRATSGYFDFITKTQMSPTSKVVGSNSGFQWEL